MDSLKNLMPCVCHGRQRVEGHSRPSCCPPPKDTLREATLASVWLPPDRPSSEMPMTKGVHRLGVFLEFGIFART